MLVVEPRAAAFGGAGARWRGFVAFLVAFTLWKVAPGALIPIEPAGAR